MNTKTVNKYVVFKMEDEYYGISINNVLSIEKIDKITRIPNTPKYVLGLINLRGDVVPVIDLRMKLGFDSNIEESNRRTIIIQENETVVGLMVDSTSEVLEIEKNNIDTPPVSESNELLNYVVGIGKIKDKLIILLNLEKLLEY